MFLQCGLNKITDAQIAVSNQLRKYVLRIEKCSPKKIFTVYNGIDLNEFKYLLDCSRLKNDLEIDLKSPVIGVISRLIPQKGIESFLKAACIITTEMPEVNFIIAGEGPYKNELKKRTRELKLDKKVKFLGYIPHVPSFLPLFNVIVIPSFSEGLCISAIEAMAARRPVVAYSVGGLPEVVDNFENGFLVEKGDFVALAEKIMLLLNERDVSEDISRAARLKVEKSFNLNKMVSETENIYEKLLKSKGYTVSTQTITSEAVLR
jgi:glycosyltransferase involved in cell wall biosynthesis